MDDKIDWKAKYEHADHLYRLHSTKRSQFVKLNIKYRSIIREQKKELKRLLKYKEKFEKVDNEFKQHKAHQLGRVQIIPMTPDEIKEYMNKVKGIGAPYPTIPYDQLTLTKIYDWASFGCTDEEIAAHMFVDSVTFHNFCKRYPDVRKLVNKAREDMKTSLRRKQVTVAMEGNPQMLIHLGKNLLGQSEKITQETTVNVLRNIIDLDTTAQVITQDNNNLIASPPKLIEDMVNDDGDDSE
jgi:hypothetical protein